MTVVPSRVYDCAVGSEWPCGRLPVPEPVMSLPRSVADVLAEHVTFQLECIDRM